MVKKIIDLLCELKNDTSVTDNINENSNIVEDVGLDSLELINFILKIEDEFDIELDFEKFDFATLSSVKCLSDFIQSLEESKSL